MAQKTDPGTSPFIYKGDLWATIGTTSFQGTGSASLNGPLTIKFQSPIPMDFLRITTCAREEQFQNKGQIFTYNYTPTPDEAKGPCPLTAMAISQSSQTSWFFLGLKSTESLPAHVWCNGEGWTYSGLSVCQSKAGLIQSMTFKDTIDEYRAEPGCHLTTDDKKTFHVEPDLGFCRMTFAKKTNGSVIWHRAVFIGYKEALLR